VNDRCLQDAPIDLVLIWTRIDTGYFTGHNGLVKLAVRILTVIANSAGCERAFSDFGVIHTKPCNKLSAEKVHKTSTLKMDLRRSHIEAGFIRPRRKRMFGEIDDADSEPAEAAVPNAENSNFDDLTRRLVRASEAADEDDDSDDLHIIPTIRVPPRPQPANSEPSTTVTQRPPSHLIPLKSLFDYTMDSDANAGAGLDFYWKGGLKNLNRELAAYELLCEEEDENVPDGDEMAVDGLTGVI